MIDAERYAVTVRLISVEGENLWRATVRELPDVAEFAPTRDEALDLIRDTIETLRQVAQEEGFSFPQPLEDEEEYSGRVTLRLPKSLHRTVAACADLDGVSLNSYIMTVLARDCQLAGQLASPSVVHHGGGLYGNFISIGGEAIIENTLTATATSIMNLTGAALAGSNFVAAAGVATGGFYGGADALSITGGGGAGHALIAAGSSFVGQGVVPEMPDFHWSPLWKSKEQSDRPRGTSTPRKERKLRSRP